MKKACCWIAFVYILYILQSSVLPLLAINRVSTDFMLLFTVSFAFLHGSEKGAYAGFLTGLLQDLATGTFFGINTFAKMLIGFVCGMSSNHVYKEQMLLPVTAAVSASLANDIILAGFILLLGYDFDFIQLFSKNWLVILLYNAAFALPVHYGVYSLFQRFTETKKSV